MTFIRKYRRPVMAVAVVFIVLSALTNLQAVISDTDIAVSVAAALTILALLAALFYIFKGCKKDAARYFRYYLASYALAELTAVIAIVAARADTTLAAVFDGVIFLLLLLLTFRRNLGRDNSLLAAAIIAALGVFRFIGTMIAYPGMVLANAAQGTLAVFRALAALTLALVTGVLMLAKYADKAARGKE